MDERCNDSSVDICVERGCFLSERCVNREKILNMMAYVSTHPIWWAPFRNEHTALSVATIATTRPGSDFTMDFPLDDDGGDDGDDGDCNE